MFGIGPTELMVILVIALLLLGPQRIPEVASSLGKAIRSFRKATRDLQDHLDIDDDVRRPLEELRSALRDEPPRYRPPRDNLMTPPILPPQVASAPPAVFPTSPTVAPVPAVPATDPVAHTAFPGGRGPEGPGALDPIQSATAPTPAQEAAEQAK